ncbi:tRNA 5-methoxyuridine(34)/uridine 5-oxyacetic acid(34) synthase CmoB [Testudinibacter sp. TR-2022]|uniref:tRNA 5-methoxyuridine(34)/uridine 5-oxyacetic acid(34) synthase CmoB n=1 Tax=Testudinibacter sp. TR-2022 TaxID=2585029 RepID=UPI00111A1A05|nr:tRNA 5-methoxyuridine(34)/uridine 5-oxyacetic acid(34) synthase CmoB [Testudinibacter sp. TR-2022]TNH05788.1 tRNA 5-methoxyuridine(34)/uridine 5-oxyacetic acid(34) synthase CmoB [Pasteurellaceae bacterium Phil31]TNH08157.1 tRNA 5-methoxyuridine(34)/uridine 5-oxyacetic acid(34) synthase CmoB [Testudinibacter sp. TR-2022]TNH10821.1 tRNA 5-methoxyuridine(34)/uridine 5-oxyacetic acid(34) synthase CmoB [Testudinibacter sp. TR-2022]TNH16507.1 tRNA 5-methoxyuridine(34)/uridine 5-oxyacetic acid(34) 
MIDFRPFYQQIATGKLANWLETLPLQLSQWQKNAHGEYAKWAKVIEFLPELTASQINLQSAVAAIPSQPLSAGEQQRIIYHLKQLMPWRKGPYQLHGIDIDCEWRSDFKWNRVLPHLAPLQDRTILDVGCGSGYHMWRMVGEGANMVVGIDPTELFLCQFEAVRKLLNNDRRAHLIPLGIEQMQPLAAFDSVFSMGVLYHRKSPLDHLSQLRDQLVNGGELVLETLVIDGDVNSVLMPPDRYAKMKNVYFIPSVAALINWLEKCGFKNVRCVDVAATSLAEQRKTDWLQNESLIDFLDPNDHRKTLEGHPAPKRAVLLANK